MLSLRDPENFTAPLPIQNTNPVLLGQVPTDQGAHEILYYINRENPTGPPPQNPSADPMFVHWEEGVKNWVGVQNPSPSPDPSASPTPTPVFIDIGEG